MKLSSYFIVTEPEKMGFPYVESITSACAFSDEVVVVCGRKEQVSEDKIKNISSKIRILNTDAWPVDWHYAQMRDHLQIGLDECSGDLALKVDADHIFHIEKAQEIRESFFKYDKAHRINIGRVNFRLEPAQGFRHISSKTCFALNKTLLKDQEIKYEIYNKYAKCSLTAEEEKPTTNEAWAGAGSNQPVFSREIVEAYIVDEKLWPVNYDNTFMTREQVTEKWIRWHMAIANSRGEEPKFKLHEGQTAWDDYVSYLGRKDAPVYDSYDLHPPIIRPRLLDTIRRKRDV